MRKENSGVVVVMIVVSGAVVVVSGTSLGPAKDEDHDSPSLKNAKATKKYKHHPLVHLSENILRKRFLDTL